MNLTELKKLYVIELRNDNNINSEITIKSYVSAISKFYNDNSRIYRMTKNDIKEYLSNIRKEYSDSYYNIIGSALKRLYFILKQPQKMSWFKPLKTESIFVDIISVSDFKLIMSRTKQIKHKLIMIIFYSTGIRLSELLNIKLNDIDLLNNRIFINTSKNGKNRYVQLHDLTKRYLLSYLKTWHPSIYLFEGKSGIKYTASSVRSVINKTSENRFYPHLFRHTFLTNVIEKEDVFTAKELAGHRSLKSTLHYNHIPLSRLNTTYNPLDVIAN